jgi:ferredoxin, 2Fe-2S
MVKIVIENLGKKELLVKDLSLPVLRHIHAHFVDWMFACGGKGRCTTCKMIVLKGWENMSSFSIAELSYQDKGLLGKSERLACQTTISGDITISVPEEYKLPHVKYGSEV